MVTPISIILLAVTAALIVWVLAIGLRPMWTTGSATPGNQEAKSGIVPAKLTVVVFASCDEDRLSQWIDEILRQDYPDFDVVAVYDSGAESTAELAEKYVGEKRLYLTFIPPGSHTLNRRKLALTLGIKAAHGEYILTTVPNVNIPSEGWLSEMMAPVNNSGRTKEVVLGFSHFDLGELPAASRFGARIGTVTRGARWIGDALLGKPWRGDGNNLVFKRSLFFENKGFADGLLLEGGDDDLFVGKIANGNNTAVSVMPETILTLKWGTAASHFRTLAAKRYRSTYSLMPHGPRTKRSLCRMLSWLLPLPAAAAVGLSYPGWLAAIIAAVLLLSLYILEFIAFRRAARRLLG